MRLRGQRGQSVVELLVGMAVTSIVMGVIGGVLYAASDRGNHWADKVNRAADGFALASALQADLHSYVPCPGTSYSNVLVLNTPGTHDGAVTYNATGPSLGRNVVTRVESSPVSQTRQVAATANHPVFLIQPQQDVIRVQNALSSGQDLLVYYAPLPGECSNG